MTSKLPQLILASSSPRRRELVSSLGIDFTIIKPDIDETERIPEKPLDYVCRISRSKADAVAAQLQNDAVILSADTVVILAADTMGIDKFGAILGKPRNADDARQMLRKLRGRAHQVYTCVTVLAVPVNIRLTELVGTTVYMRDYTDAEIDAYIATGDPFDKAGSYAIQHTGFHPVERIEGCYTNVVGLPLCAVKRALAAVAWPGMIVSEDDCDCEPITF